MARAVIFDLDGTLVDSLPDIAAACNYALRQLALPPLPEARYAQLAGVGTRALLRVALREAAATVVDAPESTLQRAVQLKLQFEAAQHDQVAASPPLRAAPFAGVPALLHALQAAQLPMAVLSNKPQHTARVVAHRLFPDVRFRHVRGAAPDAPLKPDPSAALHLARHWLDDVPPPRCAFVGDTEVDVCTARNAGMRPLAVAWGFRPAAQLRHAGAVAVAADAPHLLRLLLPPPPPPP